MIIRTNCNSPKIFFCFLFVVASIGVNVVATLAVAAAADDDANDDEDDADACEEFQ